MGESKDNNDPRITATGIIASCGVGALAICGVFGRMIGGGFIVPAMVIGGGALGIAAVWKYGGRQSIGAPDTKAILELETRVKELEERIETAETIERFEDRLAMKEATLRIEASSSDSAPESKPPDKALGAE